MRGRAVWLAALREVVRAHEVSNREALSRRCRPQEEYQSRRDRLEGIERDCYLPRSDLGRLLATIDSTRNQENLSSAVRLFVLNFYRAQLEIRDRHNVIETALRSPIRLH